LKIDDSIKNNPDELDNEKESITKKIIRIKELLLKYKLIVFCVFYDFMITLALFPSVTTKVASRNGFTYLTSFHFLIFNLSDWLGKSLPGHKKLFIQDTRKIFLGVLSRSIFILIFLFSGLELIDGTKSYMPNFLQNDYLFLIFVFLFGLSNGYFCTLSMMNAPGIVKPEEQATMGTVMALFLSMGLVAGSLTSFPVIAVAFLRNPFHLQSS